MLLVVYGDDAFRVKERARELVAKFIEKHDPTRMNVDEVVFGKKEDLDLGKVAEVVQAAPFLAAKRLVRIDGMLSLVTTKPDAEPWAMILSHVPESTVVLLVDALAREKIEKTELSKRVFAMNDVHQYPLPMLSGGELRTWIQQRARVHGATLVPSVIESLIVRAGGDTWRLETEIAKLAAYAGEAPVTEEMVTLLVPSEFSEDIFGFMDAMTSGRPSFALKKLHEEREAGADDFPLFGMLVRQIRLLLQTKALLEERSGAGKQDVATEFGVHPFVAQKVLGEAKRVSMEKIQGWHALASDLDSAMKRGLAPDIAVDRLVAALLDDR
ncbi:MAG: DNA polymerase III subunit delta [Patescibacteria group bacterium]